MNSSMRAHRSGAETPPGPPAPAVAGGASPAPSPAERDARLWRRATHYGLVGTVVIHLLALLVSRTTDLLPTSPFSAAGPPMGDVRAAAGGGGGMEAVEVRVRPADAREVTPEPVPVPVPVPVPEEVVVAEPEERPVPVAAEPGPQVVASLPGTTGAGQGSATGSATGPGTATGTGLGAGGTAEEGGPSSLVPPTPRGMILPPPDRPASARGQEVTVWVYITDRGRVVPDSTRLEPPTPDRRYNERLRRSAAEWVFEPARRAGRAVAAWYPFQIIL